MLHGLDYPSVRVGPDRLEQDRSCRMPRRLPQRRSVPNRAGDLPTSRNSDTIDASSMYQGTPP